MSPEEGDDDAPRSVEDRGDQARVLQALLDSINSVHFGTDGVEVMQQHLILLLVVLVLERAM